MLESGDSLSPPLVSVPLLLQLLRSTRFTPERDLVEVMPNGHHAYKFFQPLPFTPSTHSTLQTRFGFVKMASLYLSRRLQTSKINVNGIVGKFADYEHKQVFVLTEN